MATCFGLSDHHLAILQKLNIGVSIVKPTRCTNVSNLFNFGM